MRKSRSSSADLKHLVGLESLSADVVGGRLHVQYDAARLSTGTISAAVADTGMRAWLEHEEAHRASTGGSRFVLLVASGVALAITLVAGAFGWAIGRAHRRRRSRSRPAASTRPDGP